MGIYKSLREKKLYKFLGPSLWGLFQVIESFAKKTRMRGNISVNELRS